MKTPLLSFALFCSAAALPSQVPLSTDEALKQLYHDYNPAKKTAQWVCTKEQQSEGMHPGWPCSEEDTTVSVSVIIRTQVTEGDATRVYLATSAKPAPDSEGEYNCHVCAPATGAAVFVWQGQSWKLESANPAIGFWGGWGDPPDVSLVAVGPERHGLLLSSTDLAQGFSSSFKQLLLPLGKSVEEVWSIEDENDDLGAIDPDDRLNKRVPYRSSAAFRFLTGDDGSASPDRQGDYYDIEVISRGYDREDFGHPIKAQNWTEIYTFKDGKYKLVRRTAFTEVKKAEEVKRK
ncbi:MAG: hypothetical protein ABSF23_11950 [Terracidiphilus sp.]|jgi:hypothetical protein